MARSLIRNNVVDITLVKDVVNETFTNRGTNLQLIQIDDTHIGTIQKYWDHYLRALSEDVKHDLQADFKKVIDEINQNTIKIGLV